MSSLIIRPVRRGDYDAWLPLWDGYNAFYGRSGETALPLENTDVTWGRFFDPAEPVHALVAEEDGDLVGLAHYLYHRSTIEIGGVCYLQDLFTADSRRRRGIGHALIEAVGAEARASGATRLYWHTHETNERAISLYVKVAERSGFIVFRRPP